MELHDDGWTVGTLKEHVLKVLDERDERYEQRFRASQKAIDESTAATEKRFSSVNEFRGAMEDASKKYITRAEAIAVVLTICTVLQVLFQVLAHLMVK